MSRVCDHYLLICHFREKLAETVSPDDLDRTEALESTAEMARKETLAEMVLRETEEQLVLLDRLEIEELLVSLEPRETP